AVSNLDISPGHNWPIWDESYQGASHNYLFYFLSAFPGKSCISTLSSTKKNPPASISQLVNKIIRLPPPTTCFPTTAHLPAQSAPTRIHLPKKIPQPVLAS
ncbi:hypothetical protein, partial [Nostoc cycadae]|uniref:hypothetical protein n=1 Tax=Nostoc cycadae TaxID=246795 RepID=UPI001651220D